MFNTIKIIIKSSVPQNNSLLSSKNLYSNNPSNASVREKNKEGGGGGEIT